MHTRDLLAIAKFLVQNNMCILFVSKTNMFHYFYFTGMRTVYIDFE